MLARGDGKPWMSSIARGGEAGATESYVGGFMRCFRFVFPLTCTKVIALAFGLVVLEVTLGTACSSRRCFLRGGVERMPESLNSTTGPGELVTDLCGDPMLIPLLLDLPDFIDCSYSPDLVGRKYGSMDPSLSEEREMDMGKECVLSLESIRLCCAIWLSADIAPSSLPNSAPVSSMED